MKKGLSVLFLLLLGLPLAANAQTTLTPGVIQFGGGGQPLTPYTPATYFGWLTTAQLNTFRASVPSYERACAEMISYESEGIPSNLGLMGAPTGPQMTTFYATPNGNGPTLLPTADYADITGDYADYLGANELPTTDMAIRWAACKWGIDEDTLRAVMWEESGWKGAAGGALQTTSGACTATNLTTTIYNVTLTLPNTTATNGSQLQVNNGCWTNYGINQISAITYPQTFPQSMNSIPFSVDFAAARIRGCINGDEVTYFQGASVCTHTSGTHGDCTEANGTDQYEGCTVARIDNSWWTPADDSFWNSLAADISSKPWPH